VTSAPLSLEQDQRQRIRRYLVTMSIRTVCFVLAAWTSATGRPWWVWGTFAVLAVVLPYVAVVMANAVRGRPAGEMQPAPTVTDDEHLLEK
jgi:uncharacterized membrane protein YdbT with pleckstrin-like domain